MGSDTFYRMVVLFCVGCNLHEGNPAPCGRGRACGFNPRRGMGAGSACGAEEHAGSTRPHKEVSYEKRNRLFPA